MKLYKFIKRPYIKFLILLRKIRFDSGRISLYTIFNLFLNKVTKDEILQRASGVAFNFTIAIFPSIIFLFTLIPYIPINNLEVLIMNFFEQLMPTSMYDVVSNTVFDIISKPRGGLLSFGFIFALYMATNGMAALMAAFNACYKTSEKRGYFRMRITATSLTLLLAFVLVLAIVLLIVGEVALDFASDFGILHDYHVYLIVVVRFVVVLIVYLIAISLIYSLGPSMAKRWRFITPGSLLASFLSVTVSTGFSFYINNFANYNKLYGSIGAMIALMIWIYILSIILLAGFELNASLHTLRLRNVNRSISQD